MNVRSSLFTRAGILLLLTSACTSTPPTPVETAPEYDSAPAYPHWAGRPVTWSKLGDIEEWLRGSGPRQYPDYVPTAELELAEGRLTLAKKEGKGRTPPLLALRLKAAETGFKAVLERDSVPPAIRLRAENGLASIEDLRAAPLAQAKPKIAASAVPAGLAFQPRTAWKAASPLPYRLTPARGDWNRITIHHSAKDSKDIGTPSSGHVADAIKDIQTVHMRDRGWGDIGYHFLIDPTGRIWQGRALDWQGAHANGNNNVANIGICLLGDFNSEQPDPHALESLEKLVDALCERHHIARTHVYGHRHFTATECPGDALMAWVSRFAAGATH